MKLWHVWAKHRWILRIFMSIWERASHQKRPNPVWFYLQKIPRAVKFTEAESRMVMTRSRKEAGDLLFSGFRVLVLQKRILEMNGDKIWTIMSMYSILLNCMLKHVYDGNFHVMYFATTKHNFQICISKLFFIRMFYNSRSPHIKAMHRATSRLFLS